MKTIKTILTVLCLFFLYSFADAQNCPGNNIKVYKGGNGCGCHCDKECVTPAQLPEYLANGWNTNGCYNCCKFRNWVDAGTLKTSLDAVTPNAETGSMLVAFTLAEESDVLIQVTDINGRYVDTVVNEYFEDHNNTLSWDNNTLSSGIYFLNMTAGCFHETKMISVVN